jgi:predicted acetyltransferase
MAEIQLLRPSADCLPGYCDAMERGWSPDNARLEEAAREHLAAIAADTTRFLASLEDLEAKGPPIRLPDGSLAERLPGFVRWIWDGDFCGSIGFRRQKGTSALPPHVLGHIGFAIVPWKRGRGYATQALRAMLELAREQGLDHVELTADPDNLASQKVIAKCGGLLIERFRKGEAYGGGEAVRFRIDLEA